MSWYVITCIVKAIIGGSVAGLSHWYMQSRMKVDLRKRRAKILAGLALFSVLFCALQTFAFFSEKYDFRGKWDAYQFRKTMIEPEAFDKPIEEPIAELGN